MNLQRSEPQQDSSHAEHEPLLQAEAVRVEFGKLVAVNDISFDLGPGDILGLIGPNGAGKTTLLRALAGIQPTTSGSARVMGFDVFEEESQCRMHIGFAPDFPSLYDDLTIDQFLTFIALAYDVPDGIARERIDLWLEQLWLTEKQHEKIVNLSRGMRQRVTVARTLVPNPVVILLDEPSGGLDPAGRVQFRQVLSSLRDQGKALIVSSHILADLEDYCTHIAIIEQGRILRFGRVGDLHDRAAGRLRYRLRLAEPVDNFATTLERFSSVSDIAADDGWWSFEFDESEHRAAELLSQLIGSGLAVASFHAHGHTLEEIYLKSGVKQVD